MQNPRFSKEFYKKASAWKNENGETCMFFGAAELHFVDYNKEADSSDLTKV